jgi:hypothetical protein
MPLNSVFYLIAAILPSGTPSLPQSALQLRTDQAAIVYDQCLARAAVRASRTDAADDAIYGLAKQECAATRVSLLAGHEGDKERITVLTAIDADKQANFPALTRKVREQRKAWDAEMQKPRP